MSLCGCGCLQACTTTLNQFSVMGGGGEVAGVLWTMDGREIYVSVVCTELN